MTQKERLALLQKKLAMLQLQKASQAQTSVDVVGHPLRPQQEMPPIRIELAVSGPQEQRVVNRTNPFPG
jgi:hypothetical protein